MARLEAGCTHRVVGVAGTTPASLYSVAARPTKRKALENENWRGRAREAMALIVSQPNNRLDTDLQPARFARWPRLVSLMR